MSEIYETSWWEYARDENGEIKYGPFVDGISSPIMRNLATQEERTGRDLPVGALWAADRPRDAGPNNYPRVGQDGLSIYCRTLNGRSWNIECRASNCTMPDDNDHRCWVRHGTVGERLTVDKNGLTCAAGAGSFFMGKNNAWHGFVRDGKLTP